MTQTSTAQLDDLDKRLLDLLQRNIPLDPRPFRVLAEQVDSTEGEVVTRLRALRCEKGVIRQISAIFDTHALGYASSLVAAKVDPDQLEKAAEIISAHPGVSHNYQRSHPYNLWYTLAVGPDSTLGLDMTVARLHEMSGAAQTRLLPTLKLFKIGVRLSVSDEAGTSDGGDSGGAFTEADRQQSAQYGIEQRDIALIRVLQQDLSIEPRPFDLWAKEAACELEELFAAVDRFQQRKQMRRFAAVLRHREAGFRANVMGMWNVPEAEAEILGPKFAEFSAVSHCYLRPAYPDLPYRVYTMVHARDRAEAEATLADMSAKTGVADYQALWSVREFKKVRVRYFTPETAAWETEHAG